MTAEFDPVLQAYSDLRSHVYGMSPDGFDGLHLPGDEEFAYKVMLSLGQVEAANEINQRRHDSNLQEALRNTERAVAAGINVFGDKPELQDPQVLAVVALAAEMSRFKGRQEGKTAVRAWLQHVKYPVRRVVDVAKIVKTEKKGSDV
jgi:hypothetical protein